MVLSNQDHVDLRPQPLGPRDHVREPLVPVGHPPVGGTRGGCLQKARAAGQGPGGGEARGKAAYLTWKPGEVSGDLTRQDGRVSGPFRRLRGRLEGAVLRRRRCGRSLRWELAVSSNCNLHHQPVGVIPTHFGLDVQARKATKHFLQGRRGHQPRR